MQCGPRQSLGQRLLLGPGLCLGPHCPRGSASRCFTLYLVLFSCAQAFPGVKWVKAATGANLTARRNDVLELLKNHGPRLLALFTRLTLRTDVAEDLLQELFLKLNASTAFAAARNAEGYATQAAVHLAFDWRRRENRRRESTGVELDAAEAARAPLSGLIDREELEPVLEALGQLSPLIQTCVVLHYLQQESYENIAVRVERTPHQARALCHKGLYELRHLLGVGAAAPGESSHEHTP